MTGFNSPYRSGQTLFTEELKSEMLALWCAGRDTLDIARQLCIPECDVARQLPKLLEPRRSDKVWEAVA